jgi:hypothetical protein
VDDSTPATPWIEAKRDGLPQKPRAALQSVRETLAAAAPEAVDTISYAMPAFRSRRQATRRASADPLASIEPRREPPDRDPDRSPAVTHLVERLRLRHLDVVGDELADSLLEPVGVTGWQRIQAVEL